MARESGVGRGELRNALRHSSPHILAACEDGNLDSLLRRVAHFAAVARKSTRSAEDASHIRESLEEKLESSGRETVGLAELLRAAVVKDWMIPRRPPMKLGREVPLPRSWRQPDPVLVWRAEQVREQREYLEQKA